VTAFKRWMCVCVLQRTKKVNQITFQRYHYNYNIIVYPKVQRTTMLKTKLGSIKMEKKGMNLISCSFFSFCSSKVNDSQNSIIWLGIDHSFTFLRNITNAYDALWPATGKKKESYLNGHKKEWAYGTLVIRERYQGIRTYWS
jgi:hypothetical protein